MTTFRSFFSLVIGVALLSVAPLTAFSVAA